MDTTIFTDPVKIGPGIWFKMHIEATKATTDPSKIAFVENINAVCDNFKCLKCKTHFRKFIDTHHFRSYWSIYDDHGKDIGFFQWTWELHNQVNKFLGKYQPTLAEAYAFYTNAEAGTCATCAPAPEKTEVTKPLGFQSQPIIKPIIQSNQSNQLNQPINQPVKSTETSESIPPILTKYLNSRQIQPHPLPKR